MSAYNNDIGFAEEADRIAQILDVRPGISIGDVRAGTGRWTVDLARRIGEGGVGLRHRRPRPPQRDL